MIFDTIFYFLSKLTFFAGSIIGGSSFAKPLSKQEEEQCLALVKQGDTDARDKLVKHNMRLVAHIVKKYSGSAETDDLISVGSIGLIKAINTYEVGKGTQLATYTARCIENEILMTLRSAKRYKNTVYLQESLGTDSDGNDFSLMDVLAVGEESVFRQVEQNILAEKLNLILKTVLIFIQSHN